MSKDKKLLLKILQGESNSNIIFSELCRLLINLGFKERIKGSHHIYIKDDVEEILNLQSDNSKAKTYQVKQVRNIIYKYNMGANINE
ncbi:MAG: type II toxin-antitoxin system HicA family toxin [Nitrospirae bacterium]|nr:type II toxin-antitoxin system HicA family toxin [Nitrospirota bacterium]